MISMLSLFKFITCSSSLSCLQEIKLIVIVNSIFHVSHILRLFLISFKYGLIFLRYVLTDSVFLSPVLLIFNMITTTKITYSYWFIIISFFMLKKIPCISNYSVFYCFISFFSLKRVLIPLIAASFVSFFSLFSLKRFLTYLCFLLYFYFSQVLNFPSYIYF